MAEYAEHLARKFVDSAGRESLCRLRLTRTFQMTSREDYIPRDMALTEIEKVVALVLDSKTKSDLANALLRITSITLQACEANSDSRIARLLEFSQK